MNPPPPRATGLIAGAGRLPFLVADGVLRSGHRLVTAGLKGFAGRRLVGLADDFRWVGLTRLGSWIRFFRSHGVREAVMVGSVRKGDMYSRLRVMRYIPDLRTMRIWYGRVRGDKRDNAVLLAVAEELQNEGIDLVSSVTYCKEHLAESGTMTRAAVGASLRADVEFGWRIARASAELDIGQSIAVKERDIIAVEAVEGTDAMIRRAGELCPVGGWVMVKVARPEQDMRFDVPTVGPQTISLLAECGCKCLVLEAGRTIVVDKPVTLELADRLGVAVVGKTAAE